MITSTVIEWLRFAACARTVTVKLSRRYLEVSMRRGRRHSHAAKRTHCWGGKKTCDEETAHYQKESTLIQRNRCSRSLKFILSLADTICCQTTHSQTIA